MKRRVRITVAVVVVVAAVWLIVRTGNTVAIAFESGRPSESFGSTGDGRLVNGKRLPTSGSNFRAYSRLGTLLGRNSVHGAVRDVVLAAYSELETNGVRHRFVYGETGWPRGGPFPPHHTHQNGLSVDFMVPVVNRRGDPVPFPTSVTTRFGYDLEFDDRGRLRDLRIDFAAVSAHLIALDRAARNRGLAVRRVIFAPEYRDELRHPESGVPLEQRLPFMPGPARVRHDEHYHVDFDLSPGATPGP